MDRSSSSVAVGILLAAGAAAQSTTRESVDPRGFEVLSNSNFPALSPDGRFVVFTHSGGALVPGDTNGESDVFLRDRTTGEVVLVSRDSSGQQGSESSVDP